MKTFVKTWQWCEDVREVCQALRLTRKQAYRRAARARHAGHDLKVMPWRMRLSAADIDKLNARALAARLYRAGFSAN